MESQLLSMRKYAKDNKIDDIFYIYDTISNRYGYLRSYYGYAKQDCRTIPVMGYEQNKENYASEKVLFLVLEYVTAENVGEPCWELTLSHFAAYLPKP